MTGKQKSSVLLHLLGSDVSSAILQQLPENMAAYVTAGFLGKPSPEQISQVLHDLRSLPPGSNSSDTVDESKLKKVPDEAELNTLSGLAKHYPQRFTELLKPERKQLQILFITKLPEELQQAFVKQLFGDLSFDPIANQPFTEKIYPHLESKLIEKLRGDDN